MFYTNGKILIHQDNNKEALNKAADKIEKHFLEEKGIKIEFKDSVDHLGFALVVPDEISYTSLHDMLVPNIEFRAINESEIVLPKHETVSVKYTFRDDEMKEIADENMNKQVELERLEAEKKSIVSDFKNKMDLIEEAIKDTRIKFMNNHEFRNLDCLIRLDFQEKKKYFIDKYAENTIRKVEELSKRDYGVQLAHKFEGTLSMKFESGTGTKEDPIVVSLKDKLLGEDENPDYEEMEDNEDVDSII